MNTEKKIFRVEVRVPRRLPLAWEKELIRSITAISNVSCNIVQDLECTVPESRLLKRLWFGIECFFSKGIVNPFSSTNEDWKSLISTSMQRCPSIHSKPDLILNLSLSIRCNDLSYASGPVYGIWDISTSWPVENKLSRFFLRNFRRGNPILPYHINIELGKRAYKRVGWITTNRFSIYRTNARAIWKLVRQVSLDVKQMAECRFDIMKELSITGHNIDTEASLLKIVRAFLQISWRTTQKFLIKMVMHDEWRVATRQRGIIKQKYQIFNPNCYLADPFLITHEGVVYLFCEKFDQRKNKGSIHCFALNKNGEAMREWRVLEMPYHLSYPCVFKNYEDFFLIPESAQNKTIDLYRCELFPNKWEKVSTLIAGVRAVDPTLFKAGEYYWLFATIYVGKADFPDELHLFYSDSIWGPWISHPMNPIESHPRFVRCAGQIIQKNNAIIRPAQDCTGRYGRKIYFRQVDCLTIDSYCERTIDVIHPTQFKSQRGVHTYASRENLEVIDIAISKFKFN